MTCDYAACSRPGVHAADGWLFCRTHLLEHQALDGDTALPRSAPAFPRELFFEPCGTAAAHRRHIRRGEKPCDSCIEAGSRRRNGYTSSNKKWHGIAS